MRRNLRVLGAIGLLAFILALGLVPLSAAAAMALPKGGVIKVTGYERIFANGLSGPTVVNANGSEATALRAALAELVPTTSQVSVCMEDPISFRITLLPQKGATPSLVATSTSCEGQLVTIRYGEITASFKDDCELEHAVVKILPRDKAHATRRAVSHVCPMNPRSGS